MDVEGILAICLTCGLPFYIIHVYYKNKREQRLAGVQGMGSEALDQAQVLARRLEERVDHLERILDEDVPGWRARQRG